MKFRLTKTLVRGFLAVSILGTSFLSFPIEAAPRAKTPQKASSSPQSTISIAEINQRLGSAQSQISLETNKLNQLRADSTSAARELGLATQNNSTQALDVSISQSEQTIASLRSQREKYRSDSINLLAAHRSQLTALYTESLKLQSRSASLANDILAQRSKRDQAAAQSSNSSSRILDTYYADQNRTDSLIRVKQSDIGSFGNALAKAVSDSATATAAVESERRQQSDDVKRIDTQIATIDATIADLNSQIQKARHSASAGSVADQQKLTTVRSQKTQADDLYARTNSEISVLEAEKDRLGVQTGAAKKKYDSQRQPLADAMAAATGTLNDAKKDKESLVNHKEKLRLDSAIAGERSMYEQLLEDAARGKRNARPLAEAKETDINALVGKQDPLRKKTDIVQREASMAGMTLSQKRRLVDSILATSASTFAAFAVQASRAQQNLDNFDKSLPSSVSTSITRITEIDNVLQQKKETLQTQSQQSTLFGSEIAKLEATIAQSQSSTSTVTGPLENQIRDKSRERSDASNARTNASKIAAAGQTRSSGDLFKAMRDAASARSGKMVAEQQLQSYTSQKARISQLISDASTKGAQQQAAAATEKQRLDVSIANAEKEQISLTPQLDKIKRDSSDALRVYQSSQGAISQQIASLNQRTRDAEQTRQTFASERDRNKLQQNKLIASSSDKVASINRELLLCKSRTMIAEQDARSFVAQRVAQEAAAQREAARLESAIASTQRDLNDAMTRRDQMRAQLSAESSGESPALSRTREAIRQKENDIMNARSEVQLLESKVTLAINDSVTLAGKNSTTYNPYESTIARIDSQIVFKEQEIANLRTQRQKARIDSDASRRNQGNQLFTAHGEILKQKSFLSQKKSAASLLQTDRNRLSSDSSAIAMQQANSLRQKQSDLTQMDNRISQIQQSVTTLSQQRASIPSPTPYTPPPPPVRQTVQPVYTAPAPQPEPRPAAQQTPAPQQQATFSPANQAKAQKILEQVYTYVGDGKNSDAIKLFKSQQNMLSANLDADAYSTLKSTVEGVGGR